MSSHLLHSNEATRRTALLTELYALGQTNSTETVLFHQVAATALGLGAADIKALSIVLQSEGITASHLSKRLHLTTGAITKLLDRLERRNLIKRQAHPTDRRKIVIVAHKKKLAAQQAAYISIGQAFTKLLESYSTPELALLARYHRDSIKITQSEITKLTDRIKLKRVLDTNTRYT